MEFKTLREQFKESMADSIPCSVEDLSASELSIIEKAYDFFISKLSDIKALEDDVKRLSLENINMKAMYNTKDDETEI